MSRAAAMAYRVLLARRASVLPVDPLAMLCACRDTVVMTYAEAAEQLGMSDAAFERFAGPVDAFTFRQETPDGDRYLVAYREGGNPARLRFTLAHELGHRVLRHGGAAVAQEMEADVFASHLLCPRPAVNRLRSRFKPLTAEQVAAVFYVSVSCARLIRPDDADDVDASLMEAVGDLLADAVDAATPVAAQPSQHRLS